jgi:hypothetical protein
VVVTANRIHPLGFTDSSESERFDAAGTANASPENPILYISFHKLDQPSFPTLSFVNACTWTCEASTGARGQAWPALSSRELRRDLLLKIFGKGGETVSVQPPFFCDYGSNIELGDRVFFNFNCIVLDVFFPRLLRLSICMGPFQC